MGMLLSDRYFSAVGGLSDPAAAQITRDRFLNRPMHRLPFLGVGRHRFWARIHKTACRRVNRSTVNLIPPVT